MLDADFTRYAAALHHAGVAAPVLVIDFDALEHNIASIGTVVRPGQHLRLVAKSLPVPDLLRQVLTGWDTNRLMTFSVAMLRQLDSALPGRAHLMGKPVPVAAVADLCRDDEGVELAQRVVWLVDTQERIAQFAALAAELHVQLSVAAELDVGLHRGGFSSVTIPAALHSIADRPGLHFSGLMGYEPHLPALPDVMGIRSKAQREFSQVYASAIAQTAAIFGEAVSASMIRNTAGSKTLADRAASSMYNDLSVGSLLVKPSDFADVHTPSAVPALFIATPVVKVVDHLRIPGLGGSRAVQLGAAGGARRGVYIHGGHWLADPIHPPGYSYSKVVGRSSNQELLVTRGRNHVKVDDFMFLQPHQSEAVMLQFGPLAVISGDRIVDWWAPFPPTA